jgi:hypothetical protein
MSTAVHRENKSAIWRTPEVCGLYRKVQEELWNVAIEDCSSWNSLKGTTSYTENKVGKPLGKWGVIANIGEPFKKQGWLNM